MKTDASKRQQTLRHPDGLHRDSLRGAFDLESADERGEMPGTAGDVFRRRERYGTPRLSVAEKWVRHNGSEFQFIHH